MDVAGVCYVFVRSRGVAVLTYTIHLMLNHRSIHDLALNNQSPLPSSKICFFDYRYNLQFLFRIICTSSGGSRNNIRAWLDWDGVTVPGVQGTVRAKDGVWALVPGANLL